MIKVQDNFLSVEEFKSLQHYCFNNDFSIVAAGDKSFSVLETPKQILEKLEIEGQEIIFSFIRSAYKEFDTDLRIHADNIINGHMTSMASVLYVSNEDITPNGTCFYKHNKYGLKLPKDCSAEDFDKLLSEDSNDESKWEKKDIVCAIPNRLLTYDSNYFHSKYPKVIENGTRIVLVCFYKSI